MDRKEVKNKVRKVEKNEMDRNKNRFHHFCFLFPYHLSVYIGTFNLPSFQPNKVIEKKWLNYRDDFMIIIFVW